MSRAPTSLTVFISTPISNFSNMELTSIKRFCQKIKSLLKSEISNCQVFCAALNISSTAALDSPESSAEEDLAAVSKSDAFIFIYPRAMPSSALIELGYALAMKKSIFIISPSIDILPFVIKGIMENKNMKISLYLSDYSKKPDRNLIDKFVSNLK